MCAIIISLDRGRRNGKIGGKAPEIRPRADGSGEFGFREEQNMKQIDGRKNTRDRYTITDVEIYRLSVSMMGFIHW